MIMNIKYVTNDVILTFLTFKFTTIGRKENYSIDNTLHGAIF